MNQVTAFIIKYKWVIIAIIVLIIVIAIAYNRGKSYRPGSVALPPDINPGDSTTFNPTQYTDDIYNDLSCWFCVHSVKPYDAALRLSNTQLVAVWNDWNRRYYEKFDNQNLITAINGDYSFSNGLFNNSGNNLVVRLEGLNLNQ